MHRLVRRNTWQSSGQLLQEAVEADMYKAMPTSLWRCSAQDAAGDSEKAIQRYPKSLLLV